MQVSIAFAAPTRIWRQNLEVPDGTTVQQALELSDFSREFPEFTDHLPAVGIYGQRCSLQRTLQAHDRVELYRPLVFDPTESRRRRAAHRKKPRVKPR